jgi:hypothetical protein
VRKIFAYIGNRTQEPYHGTHGDLLEVTEFLKFMAVSSVRIGGLRVRAVAGGMYKSDRGISSMNDDHHHDRSMTDRIHDSETRH